jgi:LuxR family maltose regulon positive regulatory protein
VDLALGDYRAFDRHYEQGVSWIQQMDASRPSLPIYHAIRARALWLQNRTDELAEIDARMHLSEDLPEPPECRVVRRITAGIVALAKREIDQSIQILQQAAEMQSQMLPSLLYSDARILLAQIYHAQGAIPEAAEVLRDVLVEYRQKSFPGLLMKEGRYVVGLLEFAIRQGLEHRFAKEVLGKWERLQSLPKKVPETGEVITPRELEVLSLLAAGRSNRQIAAELVITERTVKSHITSLFRKLDVSSRTQAMARAHELQLVDY